ncbi:MAG: hypothetical protein KAS32_01230 [Candidatus Peribacteraceae bacterium]|nr:hypothetical protein [Candidatus Peribacteraceae bacterium]
MGKISINEIIQQLKEADLQPYIHARAASGSVYVKFKVNIGGALRIATHKQRNKYAYRWNLRIDVTKIEARFKKHMCYYYPLSCFKLMTQHMVKERNSRNN